MTQQTWTAETVKNAIRFTGFGMERYGRKYTAAEQRSLFGQAPFGRLDVQVIGEAFVISRKVCYGSDWAYLTISFDRLASLLNSNKRVPSHW